MNPAAQLVLTRFYAGAVVVASLLDGEGVTGSSLSRGRSVRLAAFTEFPASRAATARHGLVGIVALMFATGLLAQTLSEDQSLQKATQAGTGTVAPADSPSARVDPNTANSPFAGIGSLNILSNGSSFIGTGVAISPWFVLTAGHNLDANDNGVVDPGLQITFNLNAGGNLSSTISAAEFYLDPSFTGFLNPTVNGDLGLLRLSQALPPTVPLYPLWSATLTVGQVFTVAGYGQSGTGDTGYTIGASLATKRTGQNVVDSFWQAGGHDEVFIYDFDSPSTVGSAGGSLGNGIETLIGPGDSGAPLFIYSGGQYFVAGINTFTMGGNNGRFGDQGGGILLEPHLAWVEATAAIPEPADTAFLFGWGGLIFVVGRRISTAWPTPFNRSTPPEGAGES